MPGRLVAVDASSLIGLSAIGALDLLQKLFGTVVVTSAVRDEVLAGEGLPGATDLEVALATGWLGVVDIDPDEAGFPKLGPGEASTLQLATKDSRVGLVVIDEQLGRAQATALGVPVTGTVGVLLACKQEGHIEEVSAFLQRLEDSGFRLSRALVQEARAQAGE